MLDAFIIERIHRERDKAQSRVPLHIHVPRPQDDPRWREERHRIEEERRRDRTTGNTIVDFNI